MNEQEVEYCTYTTVKIDAEVHASAKAAAALSRKDIQDWISDLANDAAAKVLNRKPLKRRPPPPPKK